MPGSRVPLPKTQRRDAKKMMRLPSISSRIESHLLEAKLGSMQAVFASTFCSMSFTNLKVHTERMSLGVPLPLLKTIGLDSGDPTNGLPKPAVDRRSCRTFHSSKLTRGGDVDFLKQPISNSNRDDDCDENWIGDTDYSDCPDDSEALSEEAVERCRDGKVDVVDIFRKSVHNPAFRVCVKEGHGRPEVQVDDMNKKGLLRAPEHALQHLVVQTGRSTEPTNGNIQSNSSQESGRGKAKNTID